MVIHYLIYTLFGWGVKEGREGKGKIFPLLFLFGWKFNRRLRLMEVTKKLAVEI
jgi:hypothetical protein